ncbi:MAG: UDP-N-acetylmuramate dehydrogenase [Bdellovibrionaceae bacterium]|nr:UDP-N-acetylmuramate dehydrogenase [Pseudobdellovibrionaceae bacterium]
MEFLPQFQLAPYTTWKIGGAADWAVQPTTVEEVQGACLWAKEKNLPITVISGGSNILVSDDGIVGLVILMNKLSGIANIQWKNNTLTCDCLAGTPKSELLKIFVKQRLSPAIFLAGLPGDVGGGVVMNAGIGHDIHPKEFCEITSWLEYVAWDEPNCPIVRVDGKEMKWSYRHTDGWGPGVIVRSGIHWQEEPQVDLLQRLKESNNRRIATQPLNMPSCGSVFKNPPGNKSGRLIEECGLKGFQIGGAQVSTLHGNFIVNTGAAKAADVMAVVQHVQKTVKEQKGILLEYEFKWFGRALK